MPILCCVNDLCTVGPNPPLNFVEFCSKIKLKKKRLDRRIIQMQVGVLIGKAGDTIRYLQYNSRAKIQITRDADADPYSATRAVEITGSLDSISKAEKLINAVIAEV